MAQRSPLLLMPRQDYTVFYTNKIVMKLRRVIWLHSVWWQGSCHYKEPWDGFEIEENNRMKGRIDRKQWEDRLPLRLKLENPYKLALGSEEHGSDIVQANRIRCSQSTAERMCDQLEVTTWAVHCARREWPSASWATATETGGNSCTDRSRFENAAE